MLLNKISLKHQNFLFDLLRRVILQNQTFKGCKNYLRGKKLLNYKIFLIDLVNLKFRKFLKGWINYHFFNYHSLIDYHFIIILTLLDKNGLK